LSADAQTVPMPQLEIKQHEPEPQTPSMILLNNAPRAQGLASQFVATSARVAALARRIA
jgi:hypothetical protein